MSSYGTGEYTVKYVDDSYQVYAEGFGNLSTTDALKCLEEIDQLEVEDPCGEGKINMGGFCTKVHPGLKVKYSYWRVSSWQVYMNIKNGGNYKIPGIYTDKDGTYSCVYEYEN